MTCKRRFAVVLTRGRLDFTLALGPFYRIHPYNLWEFFCLFSPQRFAFHCFHFLEFFSPPAGSSSILLVLFSTLTPPPSSDCNGETEEGLRRSWYQRCCPRQEGDRRRSCHRWWLATVCASFMSGVYSRR